MAEFDEKTGQLTIKVVYYGPARSGKTTNLQVLHALSDPTRRGSMVSLADRDDTTLFFDLFPMFFTDDSGVDVRFKMYTVPGQVHHNATRKAVLVRADAVAFIADSRPGQATNNFAAFTNLEENLVALGMDSESLPLVVQYNKRDLDGLASEQEIRNTWNPVGVPVCFASALMRWGVPGTFMTLLYRLLPKVAQKYSLSARGFEVARFLDMMQRSFTEVTRHEHVR